MSHSTNGAQRYVAPELKVLGVVQDLTLVTNKTQKSSDGLFLISVGPIGNASA